MYWENDKYYIEIQDKGNRMSDVRNKITVSYTRPNTTVDWGPNIKTPELQNYYQSTYIDTGMLVSETVTFSEDGLTLTRVNIWNDSTPDTPGLEIMIQYKTDATVQAWITERNAYNVANGIMPSIPYTELLEHEDNLMFTGTVSGPYERI
jgi:hypothetical protein